MKTFFKMLFNIYEIHTINEKEFRNMKTIGIDVGGTTIKGSRFDEFGKEEVSASIRTEKQDFSIFVNNMFSLIGKLIDPEVKGIGIVSAGDINADHESYGNVINIPCLKERSLGKEIEKKFNLPVYIENDAVGALVGEASLRKEKNIEMLTFGTGIGSACLIDGKPYHGDPYDFGHVALSRNGYKCKCGKRGCSEVYLSAIALWKLACKRYRHNIEVTELMDAYRNGDKLAHSIIDEYSFLLNKLLGIIDKKLAPEVIILGGGLMGSSDVFKEHIKKYNAKIEFAVMGNKAGALGASILIRRELENGRKVN